MKVHVTGSTGFIGSHLVPLLESAGHTVVPLVRPGSRPVPDPSVEWDPDAGWLDRASLEGSDAVVHLAGESIAAGRWTARRKEAILGSRERGTMLLSRTLAELSRPPGVLVSASAIGYYGDRGDERLDESKPPGSDFLARVCRVWEDATSPAASRGIRVARVRFGIILAKDGGALPKLMMPFRFGVGGRIGSGRQYMSWVALDDVLGAVAHAITRDDVDGPVNVTAPNAVTNGEFTKVLAGVLSRPALLPLPAFAARLLLGEMADALLLSSQRVVPARLTATGYAFQYVDLEVALRHVLGRPGR